ncbi:hypothetical protein E2C01_096815 [Portunus trituberculatus]|uniref:Uncharacterized protein n=1 Tax=Portunus trituberculatus TaxID=210409 RepID=A0A5B7K3W4_PORTR|nr:hypothetical protein [Portunus trituberculatus]
MISAAAAPAEATTASTTNNNSINSNNKQQQQQQQQQQTPSPDRVKCSLQGTPSATTEACPGCIACLQCGYGSPTSTNTTTSGAVRSIFGMARSVWLVWSAWSTRVECVGLSLHTVRPSWCAWLSCLLSPHSVAKLAIFPLNLDLGFWIRLTDLKKLNWQHCSHCAPVFMLPSLCVCVCFTV